MPPSSSSGQQQQPAQPQPTTTSTKTNATNTASTAANTVVTKPQSLEQQQLLPTPASLRTLPPMAAPPPPPPPRGAPTPRSLLEHPSLLPLSIQIGADGRQSVVLPDGTPLIDGLSPDMPVAPSPLPARELASLPAEGLPLVLGLRSPPGAAPRPTADAVVGALRCQRFLSCARNKLWWMTPEWGAEAAQLPGETQFLLVELGPDGKGPYGLLLPLISDGTFRATLRAAAPAGGGGGGLLGGLLGGGSSNGTR
jgi:hypothetical protein